MVVASRQISISPSMSCIDELHRWALARRREITLEGLHVSVAPVEYVILRKLEYFHEGRSEKHVRDIRGMLEVSSAQIDRPLLEQWIARLGLAAEWATVLDNLKIFTLYTLTCGGLERG
jgi:hypothetical protein